MKHKNNKNGKKNMTPFAYNRNPRWQIDIIKKVNVQDQAMPSSIKLMSADTVPYLMPPIIESRPFKWLLYWAYLNFDLN